MKKILILASNLGLWGEELQAPWDALKNAGFSLTLATEKGITPLPLMLSIDKDFIDPVQNYNVNPAPVVDRVMEILKNGEWDNPVKIANVKAEHFDAMVIVGGPGSPLDLVGNAKVHRLLEQFYAQSKVIGALCYAVGAFVWARKEDDGKSIINGKQIVAHPKEWDFTGDLNYPLFGSNQKNPGTDLVTPGFVFPLQMIIEDAVGESGKVIADPSANRNKPVVHYDPPFVSAQSVESSIAFGNKLVEVLLKE